MLSYFIIRSASRLTSQNRPNLRNTTCRFMTHYNAPNEGPREMAVSDRNSPWTLKSNATVFCRTASFLQMVSIKLK